MHEFAELTSSRPAFLQRETRNMEIDLSQLRGRTVLVIGATGFIGRHLVSSLNDLGAIVVGASRRAATEQDDANWQKCDASDPLQVSALFDKVGPEIVYQLTSDSRGGREISLIAESIRNDLIATINVLTEATQRGVARVVIIGSLEEPKGDAALVTPSSPYAAAKWTTCAYARMFSDLYGLPVTVLRLMMTYGPGQKPYKVIPHTIQTLLAGEPVALTSAARKLDWVYIDDAIDAILRAGLLQENDARSIDIGSGTPVLMHDLLTEIGDMIGRPELLSFGSLPCRAREREDVADPTRAASKLGWHARTSLADGLRRTIAFYRSMSASVMHLILLQALLPALL
jgi:UDP-glucose 4-epimerase